MAIYENLSPNGHYKLSERIFLKLKGWLDSKLDEKVSISIEGATTSVTDYLVSPYTLLSALPFGDSSLRLGDGSIFVHKDEMIESTMMVIYQNGLKTYTLAVDENTAEVTSITDQGSWMLSQVGLSVNDIYNPSYWVGTNPSLKSTLGALNTTISNLTTRISNLETRATNLETRIPNYRIRVGTKVITAAAQSYLKVFTNAEIQSLTGLSSRSNANTVVYVANGDYNAQGGGRYPTACIYESPGGWYISNRSGINFAAGGYRVNYIVVAW